MYFFTADEHYNHTNIIKYCNRPFDNIEEMDSELIKRHNEVVGKNDIIVHAGDFCWLNNSREVHEKYISKLKGNNIILKGSHDNWMKNNNYIFTKMIEGYYIVVCHYAFRVWERSHYNSWNLYGHSHGRLEPVGKQWDIGVDNNNFYPLSFDELKEIMLKRPDNFNLIKKQIGK